MIFFCLNGGYLERKIQKYLLSSPLHFIRLLSKSLHLKDKFLKIFKYLLLRNDKGGEAETWHTC